MNKVFISALTLEQDAWHFALQLHRQQLYFDWIIGVARGGLQIALYIQEALALLENRDKNYGTIHAAGYHDIAHPEETITIRNPQPLLKLVEPDSSLLIIDDVFDRGLTLYTIKKRLDEYFRKQQVTITLGALYYKPENNMVPITPDYYFKTCHRNDWLVFPHELHGLSSAELQHKGFPINE